jgi:hypothetical protein
LTDTWCGATEAIPTIRRGVRFFLRARAKLLGRGIELVADSGKRLPGTPARGWNQGLAFVAIHETRSLQQTLLVAKWHGDETVLVGVNQLAGLNLPAEHFDFAVPADGIGVCVPDGQPSRDRLELRVGHLINVTDCAVANPDLKSFHLA